MYSFASQTIGLLGVPNARELGGYVLPDGRRVKRGLLIRTGELMRAADSDVDRLSNRYGVKLLFDFRNQTEAQHHPDREIPGAKHIWLPTLDPVSGVETEALWQKIGRIGLEEFISVNAAAPEVKRFASTFYTAMVDNEYTQVQYAAFFQSILNCPDGAILWHCSQGKDRTGLGAAFILAALGADRELILQDYRISNEVYAKDLAPLHLRVRELGGGQEEEGIVTTFIGVYEPLFLDALNLIDSKYGGMQNYLREILMLSEDDIATLKARYLEP